MAYNPQAIENISSTMGNSNPGKGSGRRKKKPFTLNKRKRYSPPLTIPRSQLPPKYRSTTYAEICDPNRALVLADTPYMKATTARNNDGMSFVW